MTFVDGLARLLAAAGVAAYQPDGTPYADGQLGIYLDGMPAVDADAIVLTAYPGPEPDDRNGWLYPRVQVRVRAATTAQARDLDLAVFNSLQAIGPLTLTDPEGTELQDCHALQSAPQPIGQDSAGRQELTRNYQLTIT